jgi:hypothetical protein
MCIVARVSVHDFSGTLNFVNCDHPMRYLRRWFFAGAFSTYGLYGVSRTELRCVGADEDRLNLDAAEADSTLKRSRDNFHNRLCDEYLDATRVIRADVRAMQRTSALPREVMA